jgi:putative transposase
VASDLLPGRSSGGRGGGRLPDEVETIVREVLRSRYLTRQRRSVAAVCREIARQCRMRGLRVPSRGTASRRIEMLDPVKATSARKGADAARTRRSAGGVPPEVTGLLEQVQIDHTPVDVIVVDERHRLPIGRPYVTAAICVCSRCVVGLVVTLEAPSATSVGLCLAHMATDKRAWLERFGVDAVWPMRASRTSCTWTTPRSSRARPCAGAATSTASPCGTGRRASRTSAGSSSG